MARQSVDNESSQVEIYIRQRRLVTVENNAETPIRMLGDNLFQNMNKEVTSQLFERFVSVWIFLVETQPKNYHIVALLVGQVGETGCHLVEFRGEGVVRPGIEK